jgi:hypothetical protein
MLSKTCAALMLFACGIFAQTPLTNGSIGQLLKGGVSEEIVLNMVQTQPVQFELGADKILELKRSSVSDKIVAAMIARSSGPVSAPSAKLKLQDGTMLGVTIVETVSSATAHPNDVLKFEVAEDVKVGEVVAIPQGTPVVGHVVTSERAGRFGKGGKLDFSLDYATAPDGTTVRLKSSSGEQGGKQSAAALMLGLSGAFMKGKNVEVVKGTVLNAFVDGDRELSTPVVKK